MNKAYNSKDVEDKWYSFWEQNNLFRADEKSRKPSYCIVIPPPNVTGVLTMGHVLNNTIQDIMIRRKRMQGYEVLWLPGTDHAGIATQIVVEKALKKEGKIKHRDDLGRDEFIKKTWEWKKRHGDIIIRQLKKLGCSCDWSRLVFTMDGLDPGNPNPAINYSNCVKEAFIRLYKKGLIYRGMRMVNWCPVSRTALSDEEVEMKEVDGHLWYIKYPLLDEAGKPMVDRYITVATTRPESMLGDEAVAVNPNDKRYKDLIGHMVLLPLKSKPIPIIADDAVDMSFGTGAVKVTPAHDPVDYDIAMRHNLPLTTVIGHDGTMTESAGEKYEGLDRFECRRAVVADLEEWGLMLKVEPYRHNIGFSQRADVPIEPMLSEQWFLRYPKIKKSLKAVIKGDIKFWPDRWVKVYEHWMENLKDWCISRQLWWGHRIPVWYCKKPESRGQKPECPPIVSLEQPTKCPKCGGTNIVQDEDVLDTWFSSWLWPFATMGWPKKTPMLKKFYPTADLVTGPDIIFFWVARMIMAGFEFIGKKPFHNVYFTGIIRDSLGRKMSKSLGNSPDPLDLIDTYGADGLRFGLMLIAPQGQDIFFSQDRMEVGRNFCNKLWNASRFVLMNLEKDDQHIGQEASLNPADKWILNRLEHAIQEANKALDQYDFDGCARLLYQFVWRDFCDWYVELSKVHLYGKDEKAKRASQKTSAFALYSIIRLLHPYMPFITEEIWQQLKDYNEILSCKTAKSIMHDSYPAPSKKFPYEKEAQTLEIIKTIIEAIRNIRGEHNIKPKVEIEAIINVPSEDTAKLIEEHKLYIERLALVKALKISKKITRPDDVAIAVIDDIEIFVPWKNLIDIESEKIRLTKEIAKTKQDVEILKRKLSNETFIDKAPSDVVAREKERLASAEEKLKKLNEALIRLK